jgi:cytochrome c-type biogenesis protein CcmF
VATELWEHVRPRGTSSWLDRVRQLPRAMVGMALAHLGVAVFIFGVTMVRGYELERDVSMRIGDHTDLAGWRFTLKGLEEVQGPNYRGVQGRVEVSRDGRAVAELRPEKRIYRVQQSPMTEAAISTSLTRDLYVSLGEPVDGGAAWTVRVYLKPYVSWIWGGCLLMALGGSLAASDRRYRVRKTAGETAQHGVRVA